MFNKIKFNKEKFKKIFKTEKFDVVSDKIIHVVYVVIGLGAAFILLILLQFLFGG